MAERTRLCIMSKVNSQIIYLWASYCVYIKRVKCMCVGMYVYHCIYNNMIIQPELITNYRY